VRRTLILGIGEILWDLLPAGRQLGGAPANFAWHAAQLGADARVVSAVGDDADGREILARLAAMRLDTRLVAVRPGAPTGTVSVALDESGRPTYTIRERVAWDAPECGAEALAAAGRADALCFGTLAQRTPAGREAVQRLAAAARPDALRLFDINLRQR
jgi:fructokinase